jgi:hypothetical protein
VGWVGGDFGGGAETLKKSKIQKSKSKENTKTEEEKPEGGTAIWILESRCITLV